MNFNIFFFSVKTTPILSVPTAYKPSIAVVPSAFITYFVPSAFTTLAPTTLLFSIISSLPSKSHYQR